MAGKAYNPFRYKDIYGPETRKCPKCKLVKEDKEFLRSPTTGSLYGRCSNCRLKESIMSFKEKFNGLFVVNSPEGTTWDDTFKGLEDDSQILVLMNTFQSELENIKTELLEIADKGEYEDMRREVELYFNKTLTEI